MGHHGKSTMPRSRPRYPTKAVCWSDLRKYSCTVPSTLIFTFLSYPIVRVSYPIVRLSYPIVRVSYQVFRLSYRENRLSGFAFIVYQVLRLSGFAFIVYQVLRLSGFAFIVWIGIPRHFHERINEKPRDPLHFVIIVGLLNIADSYLP